MRFRIGGGLLLAGVLAAGFMPVGALQAKDKEEAKMVTVVGELVDSKCYAGMSARGADHQECAVKCAKDGIPVGVLDEKGEVHVILFPAPFFADYMAQTVRVTGKVHEKSHGLMIKTFEVKSGEAWKAVELPKTMM